MFVIEIAGIKIAIENKFDFVKNLCRDYFVDCSEYAFTVSVTEQDIAAEKALYEDSHSDGFVESVCIYRRIASEITEYDAFVLHAAAVEINSSAFCFAAKSGVGKTTHILNWKKAFPGKATIINGDKPIIRFIDGKPFVFGTPWSGKENLNCNIGVPLRAICFLTRSIENSIEGLDIQSALKLIINQIFIPNESERVLRTIDLVGKTLQNTKLYRLSCNQSKDSAIFAYSVMNNEDINEIN